MFTFFDKTSYVRFWGDLHGFCVASVDVIFPKDIVFRSQIQQRYIGIGFTEEGQMISYNRKSEMRKSRNGIDCYVFNSPVPLFMKISGGQRLRFRGMYFQESFFRENNVSLYDSFWEDAKQSLTCNEIHSPELLSVYRRIENCPLAGDAFQLWMRGQGLTAASYLLDLMQRYTSASPVYLSEDEIAAVLQAKRLIKENIGSVPTILELSKRVALNKNKLQKAFQLTEGKSVGEYIRTAANGACFGAFRKKRSEYKRDCKSSWLSRGIELLSCFSAEVWRNAASSPSIASKRLEIQLYS